MGIHGLTGFIDNNQHLLHQHHLHDCPVVVDGNNFYHFLYYGCHVQCSFGGDYDVYRRKIISTFESLKTCRITPYVIMDGAYTVDGRKLRTSLARASARIRLVDTIANNQKGQALPALAYETFMQTLNELGIHHATCQFEADNEIAVLANKLHCPVISNDSDFYIFDLNNGFLPLDYVDFRSLEKVNSDGSTFHYLHCHKYLVDDFINSFDGLNRSVLPVFASLLGNDFIDANAFSTFYSRVKVPKVVSKKFSLPPRLSKVISVLHWLNTQNDSTEFSDIKDELLEFIRPRRKVRVEKMFVSSVCGYVDVENFQGVDLFRFLTVDPEQCCLTAADDFRSYSGAVFPDWFIKSACCGEITPSTLNCAILHRVIILTQVEDLSQASSFQCSLGLRRVLYGVLLQDDLDERSSINGKSSSHSPSGDSSNERSPRCVSSDVCETSQSQNGTHELLLLDCLKSEKESGVFSSEDRVSSAMLDDIDCDVRREERGAEVELEEGNVNVHVEKEIIAGFEKTHDACAVGGTEPSETEICDSEVVVEGPKAEDVHKKQKQFCVEEYTRVKKNLLKTLVEPLYYLGTVPVPGLDDLPTMAVADRRSVLAAAMGVDLAFMVKFSEDYQLFAACLVMWSRYASPKITPGHLEAVIVGVMLLQAFVSLAERKNEVEEIEKSINEMKEMSNGDVKRKGELKEGKDSKLFKRKSERSDVRKGTNIQEEESGYGLPEINCELAKKELMGKTDEQTVGNIDDVETVQNCGHVTQSPSIDDSDFPADSINIVRLCSRVNVLQLRNMKQNLHKYHAKYPVFNNKNHYCPRVSHAFAQLQACMVDAINLNKLLRFPFPAMRPADLINGTFLYNFYTDISVRAKPDLFLAVMFDRNSDIIATFELFRDIIINYAGASCFDSPTSLSKKTRKRKPKDEKKHKTLDETSKQKSDNKEAPTNVVAGFNVANMFSVLCMDDS